MASWILLEITMLSLLCFRNVWHVLSNFAVLCKMLNDLPIVLYWPGLFESHFVLHLRHGLISLTMPVQFIAVLYFAPKSPVNVSVGISDASQTR